jgi:hypothetical protein
MRATGYRYKPDLDATVSESDRSPMIRRGVAEPDNDSAGPSGWTNPLVVEESRLSESNRRPSHYE